MSNRRVISLWLKYFLFGFNSIVALVGLLFFFAGIWAWNEKSTLSNLVHIGRLTMDPVLFVVIISFSMFFIGFQGCTGALRENTVLLFLFCLLIGLILCAEILICIFVFVYKQWFVEQIRKKIFKVIVIYRENVDLRDLVDWIQSSWLQCCGFDSFNDWDRNIYFNCSSPSNEKCGVPPSCCRLNSLSASSFVASSSASLASTDPPRSKILNLQCGRNIRHKKPHIIQEKIFTRGCLSAARDWIESNQVTIACSIVVIAVIQVFAIYLVQRLRDQILTQKKKWSRIVPPQPLTQPTAAIAQSQHNTQHAISGNVNSQLQRDPQRHTTGQSAAAAARRGGGEGGGRASSNS